MKVAVVGSRGYRDLEQVRAFVRSLPEGTTVVSGGAFGVDAVAADEAQNQGLDVVIFNPNWKLYGRRAGFMRNGLIVEAADVVHAFWDGISRGTASTIKLTQKAKKPLTIHRIEGPVV